MPQEKDELELVLKYHILVQTRKLTYNIYNIYCEILFLSIIVIGTKSSIQFAEALGNVSYIKKVVRDYDFTHARNLCFSHKEALLQQFNMKISQALSIWIKISR